VGLKNVRMGFGKKNAPKPKRPNMIEFRNNTLELLIAFFLSFFLLLLVELLFLLL